MDLCALAPRLRHDPAGYWTAPVSDRVSYPPGGSEFCFGVEDRSFWFTHRNNAVISAVRLYPPGPGPIFDVGAGNGFVAAGLIAAGFETIAIEPHEAGAANCVRRGVSHVVRGTLQSAGFLPQSAGAVGLFDVLEHTEDDAAFLKDAVRCVAPGGRVYVTVPAYQALWSDEDEAGGHYRRYNRSQLRDVLAGAGCRVEYVGYLFWWLPLAVACFRVLPEKLRWRGRVMRPVRSQHTLGGAFPRRVAAATLAPELAWVRRGRALPFGGSCLAVARVPASG